MIYSNYLFLLKTSKKKCSHSYKLFLEAILCIINQKCKVKSDSKRFDFLTELGVVSPLALVSMLAIFQRAEEKQKSIKMCIIDV